jgi:hypothetical protein
MGLTPAEMAAVNEDAHIAAIMSVTAAIMSLRMKPVRTRMTKHNGPANVTRKAGRQSADGGGERNGCSRHIEKQPVEREQRLI